MFQILQVQTCSSQGRTAFVQNPRITLVEYKDTSVIEIARSAMQEEGMRLLKVFALVATLVGGALAFGTTPSSAAPLMAGAMATSQADTSLISDVQYRRHYRPYRRNYARPYYARPYYGRPYYAGPRRAVRGPRVVCRTQWRTVRTSYGWQRRPVRICNRRW
jgi:hypothetical protein